jgi:hypothetical protein
MPFRWQGLDFLQDDKIASKSVTVNAHCFSKKGWAFERKG